MTLTEVNSLSRDRFVGMLGWVFEHSPWVAERSWKERPFAAVEHLHAAMTQAVKLAPREEQLALLRAHPDLGARARMSAASAGEQSGAGLDRLTPEEFDRFQRLNAAYKEKFDFPFLFAVKGATKHDILKSLERRLESEATQKFRKALAQVFRIARFRLNDTIQET
ncbi:MAG TPA: 2-oxo-4-hydroxy-4-carboxy-5-ureidoimidazoline decarboxylase [Bryobacteraceae bacterium]